MFLSFSTGTAGALITFAAASAMHFSFGTGTVDATFIDDFSPSTMTSTGQFSASPLFSISWQKTKKMILPTKALAMSADQCTAIERTREPQAEIRYKNRVHLVTCRARPLNHEQWLLCISCVEQLTRTEESKTTERMALRTIRASQMQHFSIECSIIHRQPNHTTKRKESKTELLKNRQEKPNFAIKREKIHTTVPIWESTQQPSVCNLRNLPESKNNENKTPRPPELNFAVMRTEKCKGINNWDNQTEAKNTGNANINTILVTHNMEERKKRMNERAHETRKNKPRKSQVSKGTRRRHYSEKPDERDEHLVRKLVTSLTKTERISNQEELAVCLYRIAGAKMAGNQLVRN